MTPAPPAAREAADAATFSVCAIGYRAWRISVDGRLWPLGFTTRAWTPGTNTARCARRVELATRLVWTEVDGVRRLEPAPRHAAPDPACTCGLYAWRGVRPSWARPGRRGVPTAIGATASWGALEVHGAGFRAEHACVVALARRPDDGPAAVERLERAASRYGVALVPLVALEEEAGRHGAPLPATFGPATGAERAAA